MRPPRFHVLYGLCSETIECVDALCGHIDVKTVLILHDVLDVISLSKQALFFRRVSTTANMAYRVPVSPLSHDRSGTERQSGSEVWEYTTDCLGGKIHLGSIIVDILSSSTTKTPGTSLN